MPKEELCVTGFLYQRCGFLRKGEEKKLLGERRGSAPARLAHSLLLRSAWSAFICVVVGRLFNGSFTLLAFSLALREATLGARISSLSTVLSPS
jgi:hypothetical protein